MDPTIAIDATTKPIEHPWRQRVIKAHQKLVLNPKARVVMTRQIEEMMAVNFLPLMSTRIPHKILKLFKIENEILNTR